MKEIKLLFLLLFFSINSFSRDVYIPFEVSICNANLIVKGKINQIDTISYNINVSETIFGEEQKNISINKEIDFFKFINKKETVYLQPNDNDEFVYFIIKDNNEYKVIEQILIKNNEVFIGKGVFISSNGINFSDFKSSIINLKKSYNCIGRWGKLEVQYSFEKLKTNKEIKSFKKENEFSLWLFNEMKKVDTSFLSIYRKYKIRKV